MSIWEHKSDAPSLAWLEDVAFVRRCAFCKEQLEQVESDHVRTDYGPNCIGRTDLEVCRVCGWWKIRERIQGLPAGDDPYDGCPLTYKAAVGMLKQFEVDQLATPLNEIRAILGGRPDQRFEISPRRIEKIVASVFRSCGYFVEETQYSKDGGIDAIVYGSDGVPVPIQVKAPRSNKKVGVGAIREFLGALLVDGNKKGIEHTRGAFVTMSDFTRGAKDAAAYCGMEMELYNAVRFFDALRIAQRSDYEPGDLDALLDNARLTQLASHL